MAASPTSSIGFQNFFSTTLSSDITATSTDIFLNTVPSVSESFLVIDPDSTSGREVIYYNSKTATKVVCPSVADGRGQDDTTASAHLTGTAVIMAPVAAFFETLLGLFTTSPQGWTSLSGTISAVTYNGNRSYDLTTSSDQSAVVSPGMRLRTTRTVAAPTQCTSLNGTTQYWNDTTVSGINFIDDFTVSAWIKVSSYAAGSIISRYNGTSGWNLQMNSTGAIQLEGYNGGAANFSIVTSYQSVPLNKWVHVAAQLDMSAFTATTTTSYVMIDGVDVPAFVSRGGTNPIALVQAGNLEVGSRNSGTQFFPGKIAQVFVSSSKITQANVRTLISQGLTSALITSNSIASAYSFDGNANDLNTTSANNLTAQASAAATNADSPFGGKADGTISSTLDYAIVQKVTASTLTVQVAEGCAIPTSGGVSAASYSTYKSPYGFPGQEGKWTLITVGKTLNTQSAPAASTWYNLGSYNLTLPIGEWTPTIKGKAAANRGAAGGINAFVTLSTGASTESDAEFTAQSSHGSTTDLSVTYSVSKPVSVTTAAPYYLNISTTVAGLSGLYIDGTAGAAVISAKNAYL